MILASLLLLGSLAAPGPSISVLEPAPSTPTRAVTLAWDPNPEADLGGYRIYVGTSSGTYGSTVEISGVTSGTPADLGKVTTVTVTLPADGTYFFAVTAYDTSGNQSGYSNEVSKLIDATPPAPPKALTITAPIATNVNRNGATIAWLTNLPADTVLVYRKAGDPRESYSKVEDANFISNHVVRLHDLAPLTTYEYEVTSRAWTAEGVATSSVKGGTFYTK